MTSAAFFNRAPINQGLFLWIVLTMCLHLIWSNKKGLQFKSCNPLSLLVPGAGVEPAQPQGPRDFKSLASTSSATQACVDSRF